jgi:hypothetical protein
MPLGANPELDRWRAPLPLGSDLSVAQQAQDGSKTAIDPAIEALDLSDTARNAAYELKKKHPLVTFTSGRRDKQEQANAMAGNVVLNRKWIKETYSQEHGKRRLSEVVRSG